MSCYTAVYELRGALHMKLVEHIQALVLAHTAMRALHRRVQGPMIMHTFFVCVSTSTAEARTSMPRRATTASLAIVQKCADVITSFCKTWMSAMCYPSATLRGYLLLGALQSSVKPCIVISLHTVRCSSCLALDIARSRHQVLLSGLLQARCQLDVGCSKLRQG